VLRRSGDGHGDSYTTYVDASGTQNFVHTDGHGHVDAIASDHNHDGLAEVRFSNSEGNHHARDDDCRNVRQQRQL